MPLLDAFQALSVETRTVLILFGGLSIIGPIAVWLGLICGNALNEAILPLSLDAQRGLDAAVEDRLLNREMV